MKLHEKRRSPTPPSDAEIIELYWQRNEDAIRQTDVKYKSYLYTVAYNILHDSGDCDECLNDTYLGAWNAIPPTRPAVLKAFLTTIVRRVAINRYKLNSRQRRVPSELTDSLSDLENTLPSHPSDAEDGQLGRLLSDFIRGLPERQRYIFMGRYYLCEPIANIAAQLSVSRATVNKEIAAIKAALRQKLESEDYFL